MENETPEILLDDKVPDEQEKDKQILAHMLAKLAQEHLYLAG